MALPDRFEQVGIVVGSVVLLALPTSELVGALFGFAIDPWFGMLVWLVPGLVIGILLAAGRLPLTYHQLWVFALSSWLLALVAWAAFGLSSPPTDRPVAVLLWVLAIVVGGLIAWGRPVATLRRQVHI